MKSFLLLGEAHGDWFYDNSPSLAFSALFLASFLAHLVFGRWLYNETGALTGRSPVSIGAFAFSATFWFRTL
ncbi:MAG: DUF6766 family protein [Chthoniobacterales bacterium]